MICCWTKICFSFSLTSCFVRRLRQVMTCLILSTSVFLGSTFISLTSPEKGATRTTKSFLGSMLFPQLPIIDWDNSYSGKKEEFSSTNQLKRCCLVLDLSRNISPSSSLAEKKDKWTVEASVCTNDESRKSKSTFSQHASSFLAIGTTGLSNCTLISTQGKGCSWPKHIDGSGCLNSKKVELGGVGWPLKASKRPICSPRMSIE